MKDVRRGMSQASVNEDSMNFYIGEVIVVSILLGFYSHSWWVFGIFFVGMILGLLNRYLAVIILGALTIAWAILGWILGTYINDSFDTSAANWVLSILGLLLGAGVHRSALEFIHDINYDE